ncbi:MAG: lipid A deacylase LpxR family protein [Chitinophagales bacterium]
MSTRSLGILILLLLLGINTITFSQVINNTASFSNINSDNYFRIYYDNDYFTATDQYYTQGINIEFVHPALKKFPVSKILLRKRNSSVKYGLAIEHNAYTPTSIGHNDILYGDRPFAGCLMIKTFAISIDSVKQQRLSSAFSAGVIGPYAFAENMQRSIHRWIGDVQPMGWQNQIQNDVILNYELGYEKKLFGYRNTFLLSLNGAVRLGTLSDKGSAGFTFLFGSFSSPFSDKSLPERSWFAKNFDLYIYGQPQIVVIGYDATLQGGLFNSNSPYTIPSSDINRVTIQNNFGIVIGIKKIYLEYYQSILSKEFSTGTFHRWGGVRVGVSF